MADTERATFTVKGRFADAIYFVHLLSTLALYSTVLAGIYLHGSLLDRLQWVLNAAARWYSRLSGQNTWLHFSVTFIGWKSRKESSSVSVFLRTVVYRPTWHRAAVSSREPASCNWHLTCPHVVIYSVCPNANSSRADDPPGQLGDGAGPAPAPSPSLTDIVQAPP